MFTFMRKIPLILQYYIIGSKLLTNALPAKRRVNGITDFAFVWRKEWLINPQTGNCISNIKMCIYLSKQSWYDLFQLSFNSIDTYWLYIKKNAYIIVYL